MANTATKLARVDANGFLVLNGKTNEARATAFRDIQVHAYSESVSRVVLIDTIRKALGKTLTAQALEIVQREFVIGRVTARLVAGDFPKAGMSMVDKLDFVRALVTCYAMPLKDGQTGKLKAGQKGRRSVAQHKAIRAAAEAWSQVKAEIAPEQSNAQTQAQKNKAKRSTKAAPPLTSTKANASPMMLTHPELVKAPSEMAPVEARAHMLTQAASLLSFANKYAGQLPTDFGAAAAQFKAALDKAEALAQSVASV